MEQSSSIVYSEALRQREALLSWSKTDEGLKRLLAVTFAWEVNRDFHDEWVESVRESLEDAPPYFWSPSTCRLVYAARHNIPDFVFTSDLLPDGGTGKSGFFWFSELCPGVPLRAISWLRVAGPGTDEPDSPATFCFLPWIQYGPEIGTFPYVYHLVQEGRLLSWDPNWKLSENGDGSIITAALLFLRQHVMITNSAPAHRSVQRRMPDDRPAPLIQIVRLRTAERVRQETAEHESPEWSCQWIVRGHWRQQWYPSKGRHQPKFVAPYIKGPEDKPLRTPKATVFAVVH